MKHKFTDNFVTDAGISLCKLVQSCTSCTTSQIRQTDVTAMDLAYDYECQENQSPIFKR